MAFVLPLVLGVALFQVVPMAVSAYTSFTDWDGLTDPVFIGIENYIRLIGDDSLFRTVVANTAIFTVATVPLTVVTALVLAILLNRPIKGRVFFRTAFFAPYVTNVVAIGLVWFYIYHPTDGLLNGVLSLFGIEGPAWLSNSAWVLPAVIVVAVWQGVGYPMVILLAGLQGIPQELHEAAETDGASPFRRAISITLPLLTPQIFFVTISQFISTFQVFGLIYVMTNGGPGHSSAVYIFYLWQTAFQFGDMGYASAMAWLVFIAIALTTWAQWRLQKRWVFYG